MMLAQAEAPVVEARRVYVTLQTEGPGCHPACLLLCDDSLPVLVTFFFGHGFLRFIISGLAAYIYEGS
jgi:hypothetical protein